MNITTLMGRLTSAPELNQTPNGTSNTRFTVAVNRNYKDKDGNYPTDFINCIAWRQSAEFICKYFGKGDMIALNGSIQTRSWEDKNGGKRYATEVAVSDVYFAGEKKSGGKTQDAEETSGDGEFGDFGNGFDEMSDYDPEDCPF